ncbi:hypothetical protein BDZ89DRAFT_1065434 [Hymenopellis radicata]|nr:hypothetical protein BDZ89DRAFT_1065434 [Hymenopellis radicata]
MSRKQSRREIDALMDRLVRENITNAPPLPDKFADVGATPQDGLLSAIQRDQSLVDLLITAEIAEDSPVYKEAVLARAYAHRCKADKLLAADDFERARLHYVKAATTLCGPIPHRATYFNERYLALTSLTPSVVATLSCVGAARCMYHLREYEDALNYLTQVNVLQRHAQLSAGFHAFEWFSFDVSYPDYYRAQILAAKLGYEIYSTIGNTGAAAESKWTETVAWTSLSPTLEKEATKGLKKDSKYMTDRIHAQLHPDPALAHKQIIVAPSLQVRGSWQKLNSHRLSSRMGSAIFVHDGHLYAFGGEKGLEGPYYSELWRINLETMGDWQQLPSYPYADEIISEYTGYRMVVNKKDSKAYLFVGDLELHFFDLKKNHWGRVQTTYKGGKWPYCDGGKNYVMHAIDGKLYVIGGTHFDSPIGTDLLMVLDIEKKAWTRLSGTSIAETASLYRPGPREYACSWVGKGEKKIYIMYGDADRMGAKFAGMPHGGMTTYDYDDLWAWDIEAKTWTKHRITGNQPSKRTEMACVYNPVLDKVFAFGGYSPRVPTYTPEKNEVFKFSYYADTFMLDSDDPSVSSWKHVLTRGFPIYRAQARLFVDEATGKTYLFSGYTNSQFVPGQKHLISRSFSDVWQLRVDIEGGCFEGVNVEEEARTAKAGPWQRCFACGSAGLWKKCGGSCKGKAYFCNAQCLRDGWRAHKESHGCRKL